MNIDEIKKAIENNSNYWEKRALENKLNILENEEDYLKRISDIYDRANKDIDDKLAAVYTRYAKENGMTLDEAYKQLPKAVETQYKKDVIDYVNKAKSGDERWKQYLLNQSLMHKHSVLDQLRTEYRNVIYNIDIEETGGKFLEKIFINANYYAQYQDNNEAFARVDQNKIQALLQENWSGGGNFSQLIWKNKEQLVEALDDIVVRGFATGENYDKMSEELAKRMNTSKSNAKRLIMTESARMDNEGLLAHYKETEVEKLIFVATLDMKTSEICRAMDGQIIPIKDAQIGLNVPPLHPYCRSVISPYYEDNVPEDRIYRDTETSKSTKGNYRTYKEYLEEELGDREQAEALASTRNDLQTLIKAVGTVPIQPSLPVMDTSLKINTELNIENNVGREPMEDEEIIKEIEEALEEGLNLYGNGSGTSDEFLIDKLDKNGELKPKIITDKQYDKLLKEIDSVEIYRGVSIKNYDFSKDKFIGKGSMGSGLYFTSKKTIAQSFSEEGNGTMISAIIDKDAKIIELADVYRIGSNLYTKMTGKDITDGIINQDPLALVCRNYGLIAYYKGYDIVYNGLTEEYLVLNKKILNIRKK
jgi:SPP1 gp7 family putative phage head morphogenesis protein